MEYTALIAPIIAVLSGIIPAIWLAVNKQKSLLEQIRVDVVKQMKIENEKISGRLEVVEAERDECLNRLLALMNELAKRGLLNEKEIKHILEN